MKKHLMYLFISLIILSFIGCTPTIKLARMKPAEINLSPYKKIAIGEIGGHGGEEIGSILTQALFDSARYEVLDREHLQTIMKEQNLSLTDSFDSKTSVKVGKMIGSAALIFGKVQRREYNQKDSSSKGTCSGQQKGSQYTCYTNTITGYWNLNVDLKLIDVSTGKILATYTKLYTANRSNSATDARPDINWDVNEIFSGLSKNAVDDFMKKIAPYKVMVQVEIYTDSNLPELEAGLKYAEAGDWNSAIEQFKSACNSADNNPNIKDKIRARAHYDLGIALGYSGVDYNQALSELQKAVSINPEDAFFKEQGKIKEFKSDDERLKQQGADAKSSRTIKVIPVS
jgi:tetratricopeptide (TPR) repeat protein